MLTKNACDVLAVIATNNMMNKEAGAAGRAFGKLIKNLPFYRNMLKGFARQVGAPVKGLATDARALNRLAGRKVRHGVEAAGRYVDDAAAAAHNAANAGKEGIYNAALNVYTNPHLTNATRAAAEVAKKVGKATADLAPTAVAAGAGSAAVNSLLDED